ncbi:PRC-barrel domain-containing protein [Psychromarinibacter sp. C21-152]|uniref:PRC-barrel domain-containing protein n=1 Tax=Psychromarinibacter sediminicola TaxID=3033385 RepID=A0AAE3NNP5_9RHOB|nr:PRC-barrel domain-containing protein [Psychromarinibacter sediminicola]MDF0599306.1 PRC-barrel domain-containing protein [Psychromarinibacter sediminicola]
MRKLMMTTAVAVAMTTPAMAQNAEPFMTDIAAGDRYGSELIGKRLYVSEAAIDDGTNWDTEARGEWDNVGEIHDILIGEDGDVKAVLLDIGGFLGIGEKTVAVTMDQLHFVTEGNDAEEYFVVVQGSESMLEDAPEFDMSATVAEAASDAETMAEDAANDVEMAAEEAGQSVENAAEEVASETEQAAEEIETAAETTAEDVEQATEEVASDAEAAAENTAEDVETAAETTAEDVEQTAENMANEVETDAPAEGAEAGELTVESEVTGEAEAGNVEMAQSGETAEDSMTPAEVAESPSMWDAPEVQRDGYETVAMEDLTADMLTGTRVYGPQEESVGEVAELVLSEDGAVDKAIVDVGGFLGIGEHRIAIDFEELQVIRDPDFGSVEVHVGASQDQLEERPEYDG